MLPLENQVCTLEQAKIFKDEFELELDSYFAWYLPKFQQESKWHICSVENARYYISKYLISEYYPAPSCAELGVLLPDFVIYGGVGYVLNLCKYHIQWNCLYVKSINRYAYLLDQIIDGEHEIHAKADLLIDGLRKGYIKPENLKL